MAAEDPNEAIKEWDEELGRWVLRCVSCRYKFSYRAHFIDRKCPRCTGRVA